MGIDIIDARMRGQAGEELIDDAEISLIRTFSSFTINRLLAENTGGTIEYTINGGFSFWQYGTSQATSGYGSDDRWRNSNAGTTKAHSRQEFDAGQKDVPGNPRFYSRTAVSSVAGAGNFCNKAQRIEDVRRSSGKTMTLSFWARADAEKEMAAEFRQNFGTGGSAAVNGIGARKVSLSAGWQKYSVTVTFPSIGGKIVGENSWFSAEFWFDAGSDFGSRTGGLGHQSGTFDLAQVSLADGVSAVPFVPRLPGVELVLCQWYYEKSYSLEVAPGTNSNANFWQGIAHTLNSMDGPKFKVEKRARPTVTIFSIRGTRDAVSVSTGTNANIAGLNARVLHVATGGVGIIANNVAPSTTSFTVGGLFLYHWTADAEL